MTLMEQFRHLYQHLNLDAIGQLERIYADDVLFIDPVGRHRGIVAVKRYFAELVKNCTQCDFTIHHISDDPEHAYVRWTMQYRHPRINGNRPIQLDGLSELLIREGRIAKQTDYYDLGAMLYEHLPILGTAIRWVKRRMTQ
ncbi:hypothetical protein HMF8227_02202 [Saliniradius amylolyticus]|uniref:SnoaL-like domain-containing protein n=1 Tax=Saliniradius amylolyticus TaxID=2183582 RepID=A0A2S2E4T5_9ALTE|nr:nuclear transport factor 2 family protein [Saliniradius amylolyticus]AWL12655.1 hypothetical protein HMF8227_02202 [Saliniradius amylolyticus]